MSFYNCEHGNMHVPGVITEPNPFGITEKVCVNCFKVFDAGLIQRHIKNQVVELSELNPPNPVLPFTYECAKAASPVGVLTDIEVLPLPGKDMYSRVCADCIIPLEVNFVDANGTHCKGFCTFFVPIDVILAVPQASLTPTEFRANISAISPIGSWVGGSTFTIDICLNVVIECGANVQLLVPCCGYCLVPKAVNYNDNVCAGFFDQPLHP